MERFWTALMRLLHRRGAMAVVLLLVLVAPALWWIAPERVEGIATADGKHHWSAALAPPRRQIVWQPAEQVAVTLAAPEASLAHPYLADDGGTLYFTVHGPALGESPGTADIYRSRWTGSGWGPAEPVTALNSPGDDIGPVISADGALLLMASNRRGGEGGFDLYRSRRTADGWSVPRNLGPTVNTPEDEIDPAITADGATLLFASNRATQFDIYRSGRESTSDSWSPPGPLEGVNGDDSNERAPHLSSNGAFVYFASDRPSGHSEATSYDLYRGRMDAVGGRVDEVANLGTEINSPADETSPALSRDGFRVLFSSNRTASPAEGEVSSSDRLYSSTAEEAFETLAWDSTRWSLLTGWLRSNGRTLALLLAFAALLASLVWLLREWWMSQWSLRRWPLRRLPIPGFLLVAIALHLLVGTGSFFIYFGQTIIQQARTAFEEVLVASNIHQSHEAGQESYEKVADLQSLETVEPTEVVRQITEAPRVSTPPESAIPALPTKVAAENSLPQRAVDATVLQRPRAEEPLLQRRRAAAESQTAVVEPIKLQPGARAVESSPTEMLRTEVVITQQEDPIAPPTIAASQISAPTPRAQPAELAIRSVEATTPPATSRSEQPPLERVREGLAPALSEEIATEPAKAVEPEDSSQLAAVDVQVDRQRQVTSSIPGAELQPSIEAKLSPKQLTANNPAETAALDVPALLAGADPNKVAPPLDRLLHAATSRPEAIETQPVEPVASTESEDERTKKMLALVPLQSTPRVSSPLAVQPSDGSISTELPMAAVQATEAKQIREQSSTETPVVKVAAQLDRHRALEDVAIDDSIATEPTAAAAKAENMTIAGLAVGVIRSDAQSLQAPVRTPDHVGGVFERRSRPDVGSFERIAVDAPPAFQMTASRLDRRPARAPLVLYAEDDIGLQSMLRLRGIELEEKKDLVLAFGGKEEALAAVDQGLTWIERHQHEDGHWSLNTFQHQCQDHTCDGQGSVAADAAATGLALLPLLGDGNTHQTGNYQNCVDKGLRWLVEHQKEDGDLHTENHGNAHMYSHGIAAIALCEAYGMSKDPELREPAQRSLDFIVQAQHDAGGWRYHPKEPGDTSVMGWQIMALKSGQMADLDVPQHALDRAREWLKNQAGGKGPQLGKFGYQNASASPAMTAEALLCLEYLGAERADAELTGGAEYLLTQLPQEGQSNSYYWYYGTQVMYHMQGDYWTHWNGALHDVLLKTQIKEGPMAGTWNPHDSWEQSGGRIYATSLRLLMLEVYYRHLPLYQVLQSP